MPPSTHNDACDLPASEPPRHRVLILGGGFGGIYAAMHLEKALRRRPDIEVTLVERENFFLFTPMLHEVAASDLDPTNIVSPIRKLLKRVRFFQGEIEQIDLDARRVRVCHGDGHAHELSFDFLVLSLGSVTNFYNLPGVEQACLTMKRLGDAMKLRSRLIAAMEEADTECAKRYRRRLMTLVVVGGGFAGVETIGAANDFVRQSLRFYPNVDPALVRMVLIHPGEVILPELGEKLGHYAGQKLAAQGIEARTGTKVEAIEDGQVVISGGERIDAATVVWTAGTTPHPMLSRLPCPKERGRLKVSERLEVEGRQGVVWALGDCALVPDIRRPGQFHPPTAQHAIREGKTVAHNVLAAIEGRPARPFKFKMIGALAAIGRRAGVAEIFGLRFSGFIAWFLWRTIYLMKLPRFEKKLRVALDWTLDVFFSKDLVQYLTPAAQTISVSQAGSHGHEHSVPSGRPEARELVEV